MRHQLEKSPKRKGKCPNCNHDRVFRYYEGLSRDFGRCERINNCGYKNTPGVNEVPEKSIEIKEQVVTTIYPAAQKVKAIVSNTSSNFHRFAIGMGISKHHLQKWGVGTEYSNTVFVYKSTTGKYINMVHIEYGPNCKRNKSKMPYSLKSPNENTKYSLCLFGEHLMSDKIVCLVESEKSAVLASFFYPQFDWIATGGANKLTDAKIHVLFGKEIYYIGDADKAGKDNSTIKKLKRYEQNYTIIELFPGRDDGYDIADALIDGLKPIII